MAVDGYAFGCYFIIAAYPSGDESAEAEIHSIIQSFRSSGMPDVTYKMYYRIGSAVSGSTAAGNNSGRTAEEQGSSGIGRGIPGGFFV